MPRPFGMLRWLWICVIAAPAGAVPIVPAAFGPSATVESFEGILPGGDVGNPLRGVMEPGLSAPYDFGSGVSFTGDPNPGFASGGAWIQDFLFDPGSPANDWMANGTVDSAAAVPFGGAYMGVYDPTLPRVTPQPIEFTFAQDMLRVGAYVAGLDGTSVTIDVYDAADALLESRTIPAGSVAAWGGAFLGVENAGGISRVVFSGADFGMDALTFESMASAVPEPDTAALLGLGLLALAVRRRLAG